MRKFLFTLTLLFLCSAVADAQTKSKFNYAAQKKFIPLELGKIYLGMPFDEFAKQIDLKKAEAGDTSYDWLSLDIPFEKGNIAGITVKIHGLTQDEKMQILFQETVKKKDNFGEDYDAQIERVKTDKIPAKGVVYAMYIFYKKDFDLKNHVVKIFGQPKAEDIYKKGDEYHFYDMQWTKKTSDGLVWLVRSFHDGNAKSLQLLGRIDGTEWGLDDLE